MFEEVYATDGTTNRPELVQSHTKVVAASASQLFLPVKLFDVVTLTTICRTKEITKSMICSRVTSEHGQSNTDGHDLIRCGTKTVADFLALIDQVA